MPSLLTRRRSCTDVVQTNVERLPFFDVEESDAIELFSLMSGYDVVVNVTGSTVEVVIRDFKTKSTLFHTFFVVPTEAAMWAAKSIVDIFT